MLGPSLAHMCINGMTYGLQAWHGVHLLVWLDRAIWRTVVSGAVNAAASQQHKPLWRLAANAKICRKNCKEAALPPSPLAPASTCVPPPQHWGLAGLGAEIKGLDFSSCSLLAPYRTLSLLPAQVGLPFAPKARASPCFCPHEPGLLETGETWSLPGDQLA